MQTGGTGGGIGFVHFRRPDPSIDFREVFSVDFVLGPVLVHDVDIGGRGEVIGNPLKYRRRFIKLAWQRVPARPRNRASGMPG